jgi:hypothetical protein
MATSSWNAGIIRPVAVPPAGPYEDGAAPGVWTLDQAAFWQKQGLWPTAGNVAPVALFAGGEVISGLTSLISKVIILTLGNSTTFGSLTTNRSTGAGAGSTTRGLFGFGNPLTNAIEYVTFATAGNSTSFGELTVAKYGKAGCNSATRALFAGGQGSGGTTSSVIDYVTMDTTGNATFFGNLTAPTYYFGGLSSPTRGVFAGGSTDVFTSVNTIQYVTIASTGNAASFGDLTAAARFIGAASSATRGLFAKIGNNSIEYITIATTGNSTSFGQLSFSDGNNYGPAGASSPLYAVFAGGTIGGTYGNAIQYVSFSTLGNSTYFGDLPAGRIDIASCSSANGGTQ